MTKLDARDVRAMLQDNLQGLLNRLGLLHGTLPGGSSIAVRNPTRDDRKPGSFVIWTSGAAKGGWHEYAAPEAKGDILDLIAYVHRREGDFRFAMDYARDFLGIRSMDPKVLAAARAAAQAKAKQTAAAEAASVAARRRRAVEIFATSKPIEGSAAEAYLAAREIPLALLPNPEHDLRFVPALEYWKGAEWETDGDRRIKVRPGPKLPAMVAAMRNAHGDLTAVHLTFIRADGSGKADVEKPKLMLGSVAGSVIRLTRGPSNQTWEEAALSGRRDVLIPAEGIETGLSVAIGVPDARVVAAGSLSNIANVPVWHACVAGVVVAADNPNEAASASGQAQSEEQLAHVLEVLASHGVPVNAMRAHAGKDFNDLIRG